MRADFHLSYVEIGALMTIPGLVSAVIEPVLGILVDTTYRRAIFLAGGVAFAASVFLTAVSPVAVVLLLSWILFYPASGSFMNVAQVCLMDRDPRRREQNMAQWSLAGSLGMSAGPLLLGAAVSVGAGWRGLYLLMGALSALLVLPAWKTAIPHPGRRAASRAGWPGFTAGLRAALKALRSGVVLRWLVLLELSDLMLDVLFGYIALYFVDVAGVPVEQAAVAVVLWTVSGLLGDVIVIPLLERVPGLRYLRVSALAAGILFPLFLLAGSFPLKVALLILLGLVKAGWYSVLKARLYGAMPGRGGAAMAVSNVAGLAGSLIPLALGAAAEAIGLRAAMWLLLAAPLGLLLGLPRERPAGNR